MGVMQLKANVINIYEDMAPFPLVFLEILSLLTITR